MAVGDAHVFPGFLTPVLTQLSFQSHRLLFSHASAEVRGENTPERKFGSTGSRTHNHQVMSPTLSPVIRPGGVTVQYHAFARARIYLISIIALQKYFQYFDQTFQRNQSVATTHGVIVTQVWLSGFMYNRPSHCTFAVLTKKKNFFLNKLRISYTKQTYECHLF